MSEETQSKPETQSKYTPILSLLDLAPNELRRMTDEESKMFATLTLAGMQGSDLAHTFPATEPTKLFPDHDPDALPFFLQVMLKRLVLATPIISLSADVLLFTAAIAPNVASAVLWAHALYRLGATTGEPVTLSSLALGKFGDGFPTEDGYHRIWDAQKFKGEGTDNRLDTAPVWRQYA